MVTKIHLLRMGYLRKITRLTNRVKELEELLETKIYAPDESDNKDKCSGDCENFQVMKNRKCTTCKNYVLMWTSEGDESNEWESSDVTPVMKAGDIMDYFHRCYKRSSLGINRDSVLKLYNAAQNLEDPDVRVQYSSRKVGFTSEAAYITVLDYYFLE